MELTLFEVMQAIQAVQEVVDVINDNTDELFLPPETIDVLDKMDDNSDEPNTDIEVLLTQIRDSLVTDYEVISESGETSYLSLTVSERLDIIDRRLDTEFVTLNNAFSVLLGGLCFAVIWTFLRFVFNRVKNV